MKAIALAILLAAGCGYRKGPCNDYCDFHLDCVKAGRDCDGVDDAGPACVDACKSADEKLSKEQAELFQSCVTCIGELRDEYSAAEVCVRANAQCEACDTLVGSAESFFRAFFEKLRESNAYRCDDNQPPYYYR